MEHEGHFADDPSVSFQRSGSRQITWDVSRIRRFRLLLERLIEDHHSAAMSARKQKRKDFMAKSKKLDMAKMKTTLGKHAEGHADFKERIKNAIDVGEHKAADIAIKTLRKSHEALSKMIDHVEAHSAKKRPKVETEASKGHA